LEHTSVILFALPRIVSEFVRAALSVDPTARLVADLGRGDDLLAAVAQTKGKIAVVGGTSLTEEEIAAVLRSHPDARVLELVDDGRETFLYELRPHRIRLGQVSPRSLVHWLRSPASSAFVSGAS
jgi:hypothetical protein